MPVIGYVFDYVELLYPSLLYWTGKISVWVFLKKHEVLAVFHYIPLHTASFAQKHYDPVTLPITEELSKRLLRLPMFFGLSTNDQQKVIDLIHRYFDKETE